MAPASWLELNLSKFKRSLDFDSPGAGVRLGLMIAEGCWGLGVWMGGENRGLETEGCCEAQIEGWFACEFWSFEEAGLFSLANRSDKSAIVREETSGGDSRWMKGSGVSDRSSRRRWYVRG